MKIRLYAQPPGRASMLIEVDLPEGSGTDLVKLKATWDAGEFGQSSDPLIRRSRGHPDLYDGLPRVGVCAM